jgi:uncharacterized damage-inducible protein DinB
VTEPAEWETDRCARRTEMTWTELLRTQAEAAYRSAEGLLEMVDEGELDWKPATGDNWMTTGQLVHHITDACGAPCKGFVTGDWGMPDGFDPSQTPPEETLPPAEKLPSVESLAEAKRLLAKDKAVAFAMIDQSGEENLMRRKVSAPWDPREETLGRYLLQMIGHLDLHKAQLYYYLKLQGKPVNTSHLWSG